MNGWKNSFPQQPKMPSLLLKPGREKSLLRRHPWIFSGAIASIEGALQLGDTVEVFDAQGKFQARAAYSPHSQIRARVWTFNIDEPVDEDFFRCHIQSALDARMTFKLTTVTEAYRLIHAESDFLPGLIVDRYGEMLVMQSLTAGSEYWRDVIVDLLLELTHTLTIYERSDADVRELEGLPLRAGLLRGESPAEFITVVENGLRFSVDYKKGHKTGLYLDQRDNHLRVRDLAQGRDVLDCFCYTGGFTLNALAGGAKSVVAVDTSSAALALSRENVALNKLPIEKVEWLEGDVFQVLRRLRDQGHSFDMVILDPPKFAQTAAQAERAVRGYKDINLLAFKLLRPGGLLVTFSCSGGISPDLFQKIVAGAVLDAGVDVQIVEYLSQCLDHPVALNFPEGRYLKGLICVLA